MPSRTITNVAAELIPRNKYRKSVLFQNEDTAINIFIKLEPPAFTTVSTTDHDHRIPPGGWVSLDLMADGAAQVCDRFTVIAASGTPRISIVETEIIERQYGESVPTGRRVE